MSKHQPSNPAQDHLTETRNLALSLAEQIDEKQGSELLILDVSGPLAIADFFVIATAKNHRHATALAKELDMSMKQRGFLRRHLAGIEGDTGWILLDFDTVVVHLFAADKREFYGLENLWADVPRVPFTPAERPAAAQETDSAAGADEDWTSSPGSYPDSIGNL